LDSFAHALALLAVDPGLGGALAVGFRPEALPPGARRIAPGAALVGYATPWGWQQGLLDQGGTFTADLELLPPEAQAVLAQRMDAGGCVLLGYCSEAPWAHLADRVAFIITPGLALPPADQRPVGLSEAVTTIATVAATWQVEGHRAEGFALRAARAGARAAGRRRLTAGDVAAAVALVLAPRARVSPQAEPTPEGPEQARDEAEAEAPPLPAHVPPLPRAPVQTRPALHGAPGRTVPGRRRRGALDLPGTLLAALPWQRLRGAAGSFPPAIRPDDLRWHLHRPRQGRLVIFAVDASGSMGARRLGQAKGAVLKLLQQAYRRRDQVALILAAGEDARLLLPPSRAPEQARRALTSIPAGGGTPLSAALLLAYRLAHQARRRETRPSLLLLLTDGRANRPLPGRRGESPGEELKRCSLAVRKAGLEAMVISEPGAEARELARWLGARFAVTARAGAAERWLREEPGFPRQSV